ncbi:MAG: enoyl-CoA hydratase-related protein [Dehalococcoidia bacterium]|nr:enoyl-CoA hydratase-related protein [Dehalococcoidia bacterium]
MRPDTENRHYRYPLKIKDPTEYQGIIYEPGRVTRIILNRPRYMNALSHPMWAEVEDAFDRAARDDECNVIVVSGNGKCFSAGDDVIGLSPEGAPMLADRRTPEQLIKDYGSEKEVWHQYNIEHDHMITWLPLHKLRTNPKPTIAMAHGYCIYGGLNLAAAMDVIFSSENALFLWGGLAGGGSVLWDLGLRKAYELILEHRCLTAREAQEYHLVNRVYPDHQILEKETLAYAERVASEPPTRVRRVKQQLLALMDYRGFTSGQEALRTPSSQIWRDMAADARLRYDGKGIARIPVALYNLKAKLDSEGQLVPDNVQGALVRAAERDDRAKWQEALHQSWRDPKRVARVEAQYKEFLETEKAEQERKKHQV